MKENIKDEGEKTSTDIKKSPEIKQEKERPWLTGDILPEHMAEIFNIIKNYEFPAEAIQETTHPTMKKKILGYNAQHIINALNEIFGINHWREYGKMREEKPATAYVSIYEGTFEVGNWREKTITETTIEGTKKEYTERYFDVLIMHTTYGGSRNMDQWESLKGAKTNFLKKICSYYSVGWKSYALQLDDDFMNMEADQGDKKNTPPKTTTPVNKATPPTNKAIPTNTAKEPKMVTSGQIRMIEGLYKEYSGKVPEPKTIVELLASAKVDEISKLTMKQASDFITQFKAHVSGL